MCVQLEVLVTRDNATVRRVRSRNLAPVIFCSPSTRRLRRTRAHWRRWTCENDRCSRTGQHLLALRCRATRTRGFILSRAMGDEAVDAENEVLEMTGENGEGAGIAK